ncbi:MAG: RDD family protein [Gaiellaceae bacterium]
MTHLARARNHRQSQPRGDEMSGTAYAGAAAVPAARPCPNCHREWGAGVACQFCSQVEGLPLGVHLSSPGRRLGAHVLEFVLFVFTLGIGYLVWMLIVFARGQTPGKQLLGMRTVIIRSGTRSGWGTMFLREFIAKPVIYFASFITFGLVNLWLVWDKNNQELWDKVVGTIIVNDSNSQL